MDQYIDKITVNGATYTIRDDAATQKLLEVPTSSSMEAYVQSQLSNYTPSQSGGNIDSSYISTYVSSSLTSYPTSSAMATYISSSLSNYVTASAMTTYVSSSLTSYPTSNAMSTYVSSNLSNYVTASAMQSYVSSSLQGYTSSGSGGGIIDKVQVIDQASYNQLISSGTFEPQTFYIITE